MKPFPIPVVTLGPGTQTEDASLDYLLMPKDMDTYSPPQLPEPEALQGLDAAATVLHQVLSLLDAAAKGAAGGQVSLNGIAAADLKLINQIMGEGEASALVREAGAATEVRIQESVFTGLWRLSTVNAGELLDDRIEVAPVPEMLTQIAAADVQTYQPWQGPLPDRVLSGPLLLEEILEQIRCWQPGQAAEVVNLTLLPVTSEDIAFLDHQLGTGRVLMLSRGYGNCRITNTRQPHCWRVVYYNSMDQVILNTVEVIEIPEVAMAAPEDLRDSHTRLRDVLNYLESA